MNYLETGSWMRANAFDTTGRLESRADVFQRIASGLQNVQVLYLEFGVFEGASMREWCRLLQHPRSHLHGFDSFQGLPSGWAGHQPGHFSTGGNAPDVPDPRVRFFIGWFEDTLPSYEPPPHDRLVVNIDADLYSSAAFVLETLEKWIVPGSFLYFDEFSDRRNELQAFAEFIDRTEMRFRLVGTDRQLSRVAFERIA